MDEDEEINIVGDISIPLVSQNSDLLSCEYTVHPQWFLDKPSTNPYFWYNDSLQPSLEKSQEDFPESIGHISTENSITDESGWTEKEKNLLEKGIEIFGKSGIRLAQFIGTKTPSEIKYYLKTFYTELHPLHSVKTAIPKVDEENVILETVLIDSQIPCTSELVVSQKSSLPIIQKNKAIDIKDGSIKGKRNITVRKRNTVGKLKLIPNKFNDVTVKRKNALSKIKIVETELLPVKNSMPFRNGILLNEGEEIINIKKKLSESSDSDVDVEVDVENSTDSNIKGEIIDKFSIPSSCYYQNKNTEKKSVEILTNSESESDVIPTEIKRYLDDVSNNVLLQEVNQVVLNQLSTLNIPKNEFKFENNLVIDLEKIFNHEFFSVTTRSVKSPELYLTLRHHIISKWMHKKPLYVTKTDVRKDIDVSIDKNTLNKIHSFLEQIGAINFGCNRVNYVRPLHQFLKSAIVPIAMKKSAQSRRIKKKFVNNGEGGCTFIHGEHGEIIDTTIVNENPAPPKIKTVRTAPTYLIYCKPFTQEYKYNVKLDISTLLLMNLHAHSSLSEVMGLIGGSWCAFTKTLLVSHYEPCKNVASSTTHCDMCPVSQANSAEIIHNKNMDLLGWFHSHPTFSPEPSQQDLDTQRALQEWIGSGKPCVGIILSPFNRPHVLTPSDYRCMVVEKLQGDDVYLPYKFKVEVRCDNFDIDEFLGNVLKIFDFISAGGSSEGDSKVVMSFKDPYLHDANITYFDKFILSTKMTLEKYFSDESICQKVVRGIHEVSKNEKR